MAIMNIFSGAAGMLSGKPRLTPEEQTQLEHCVSVVKTGCQAFAKAGTALAAIKSRQLYRASHDSFEAFCEHQFGLTARRVNQLIESSAICLELAKHVPGAPLPRVEAEARALAGLTPAAAVEVWKEAVEVAAPETPSTAIVKKIADKKRPKKKSTKAAKPIRFKVPGAVVVVIPNKKAWSGNPADALQAALDRAAADHGLTVHRDAA
jgi:hypothetical protein